MSTDDTPYSVPDVWSVFYSELKGSPWEAEDVDSAIDDRPYDQRFAALALHSVYTMAVRWQSADAEDSVLAVLKAAQEQHGGTFLTPRQVTEMARHFGVFYDDIETPFDEYLDEHCGPVRLHWLNEHGRKQVEDAVCKDSEIWVDDNELSGVWVFYKPGHRT